MAPSLPLGDGCYKDRKRVAKCARLGRSCTGCITLLTGKSVSSMLLPTISPAAELRRQFQAKVKRAKRGCWEWIAEYNGDSQPMFRRIEGGRVVITGARRWGFVHLRPAAAQGLGSRNVRATCGNAKCVNPDHAEQIRAGEPRMDAELRMDAALLEARERERDCKVAAQNP